MRKLKIEDGDWIVRPINRSYHIVEAKTDKGYMSIAICDDIESASFIAEAGTVANETGLMPREMKEQRDRLLSLLKEHYSDFVGEGNNPVSDLGKRTKKAIAAAEGRE